MQSVPLVTRALPLTTLSLVRLASHPGLSLPSRVYLLSRVLLSHFIGNSDPTGVMVPNQGFSFSDPWHLTELLSVKRFHDFLVFKNIYLHILISYMFFMYICL